MQNARRAGVLLLLGSFLIQIAYICSAPPLLGFDEFEHVYKADATAHGDWLPTVGVVPGRRGELMEVTRDMARTVADSCEKRGLGEAYLCEPLGPNDGATVERATAAARYHPAFYWVVGTAARPFDGVAAVTAMRVVSGLMCAALLGLSTWALLLWARSRWPLGALALCLTPTLMYSTSLEAPNGLEMCSAVGVWVCLLGLRRADLAPAVERRLILIAMPMAAILGLVRLFGPVWLGLIVGTCVIVMGMDRLRAVLRLHRGPVLALVTVAALGVAGNAAWLLASGGQPVEDRGGHEALSTYLVRGVVEWPVQAMAQIYHPNSGGGTNSFSWVLYVVVALTALALMFYGAVVGRRRTTVALLLIVGATYAVAMVVTAQAYDEYGQLWQGRYSLALGIGALLVAGTAADEHHRAGRWWLALVLVSVGTIGVTLVDVANAWNGSVLADDVLLAPAGSLAIALIGLCILAVGLTLRPDRSPGSAVAVPSEQVAPGPRPTAP